MTIFPEYIRIKLLDKTHRKNIPNLVVSIKLFATQKNDYLFLLPISDKTGIITITKDWLEKEISKDQQLFMMDYSSNLEDCQPKLEFNILDNEAVQKAIKAQILFAKALGITDKEIDRLKKVDNKKYKSSIKQIDLHGENNVEIEIILEKSVNR